MKLQSIVVVVLRLMALSFILKGILIMIPYLDQLSRILLSGGHRIFLSQIWLFLPWLSILTFVISAILIWVFAIPFSRFLTRGVSQDIFTCNLGLADFYTIAFVGLAAFCIVDNLPQVINSAFHLFDIVSQSWIYWKRRSDFSRMLQAFIPFVFGVILLAKSRTWALALAKRQGKDEGADKSTD